MKTNTLFYTLLPLAPPSSNTKKKRSSHEISTSIALINISHTYYLHTYTHVHPSMCPHVYVCIRTLSSKTPPSPSPTLCRYPSPTRTQQHPPIPTAYSSLTHLSTLLASRCCVHSGSRTRVSRLGSLHAAPRCHGLCQSAAASRRGGVLFVSIHWNIRNLTHTHAH
jgi:hypothetical protein